MFWILGVKEELILSHRDYIPGEETDNKQIQTYNTISCKDEWMLLKQWEGSERVRLEEDIYIYLIYIININFNILWYLILYDI